MKIIIAAKSEAGHVNPVAAIARILIAEGHDVVALTGEPFRRQFESMGARFRRLPADASPDVPHIKAYDLELNSLPEDAPAIVRFRVAVERALIDPIPLQHKALDDVLGEFDADIVISELGFLGVLPMLLGSNAKRPPVIICGVHFLTWERADGAPYMAGLPPAVTDAQLSEYADIAKTHDLLFEQPTIARANRLLNSLGARSLPRKLFESPVELADGYLQLSVQGFEYPRATLPPSVTFVGALPIVPNQHALPTWASELDGKRKVVFVTQGTIANRDFGMLVGPTLAALAGEPDLLVVATTGGRPFDEIPGPVPANVRLASYLPYEWLLPKVDVLVTNGGYGGVNQVLRLGIPLVTAGLTEDRPETNARIAWSGVGIDLATSTPDSVALRSAVRTILNTPSYRQNARRIAGEFAAIDTRAEILRIVDQVVASHAQRSAPIG